MFTEEQQRFLHRAISFADDNPLEQARLINGAINIISKAVADQAELIKTESERITATNAELKKVQESLGAIDMQVIKELDFIVAGSSRAGIAGLNARIGQIETAIKLINNRLIIAIALAACSTLFAAIVVGLTVVR